MRFSVYFLIGLLWALSLSADTKIPSQISFSLGSIGISFAENPDELKASDGTSTTTTAPYSGSATAMPLDFSFEYYPNLKRSYLIKASGPLMGSTPDRYFSLSAGINFYFNQIGAEAKVTDFNLEMKVIPKMRYYAGPSIGAGYLIYNTKSATKSDVLFEIGGQGGVLYTLNPKWGLKGELGFSRAVGVLVSATVIRILIGTTYNIGL